MVGDEIIYGFAAQNREILAAGDWEVTVDIRALADDGDSSTGIANGRGLLE
jgi:hypothetical protein